MPNALNSNSVLPSTSGLTISGVQADTVISKPYRITAGGSRSSRVDLFVGKVSVTGAVSAKVQHSSGYNVWTDAKSVTITASTDKTVSAISTTTDILTSAAHGFVDNQAVALSSSGDTPAPISVGEVYFIKYLTANTFSLRNYVDDAPVDLTTAGSGTITITAVRTFSITHQDVVVADQVYTPMKSSGRVTATLTNVADVLQICDVVVLLDD